jgi:hypothetical protein
MHKIQCSPCTAPTEKKITSRVIQTFCSLRMMKNATLVFNPATICVFQVETQRVARTAALCRAFVLRSREHFPKLGLINSYIDRGGFVVFLSIFKRRKATTTSKFPCTRHSHLSSTVTCSDERRGVVVNTTVSCSTLGSAASYLY